MAQYLVTQQAELLLPAASWNEPNEDGAYIGFGCALAADDDHVIVGCKNKYHNGGYWGAAYVFNWNGTYVQEILPPAADWAGNGYFGYSLALSGVWLLVGNPLRDVVCFYEWNGSAYVFAQRLSGSTTVSGEHFGWSAAMTGSVAVVGAERDNTTSVNAGAAFVFRLSGGTWSEDQIITAPAAQAGHFGEDVALSPLGTQLLVGASYITGVNYREGRGYLYEESGGVFLPSSVCTGADAGMMSNSYMGSAVSMTESVAALGAGSYGAGGLNDTGAIALWQKAGGTWVFDKLLLPEPLDADGEIAGTSTYEGQGGLSLCGSLLAAGGPDYGGRWKGGFFVWAQANGSYQQKALTTSTVKRGLGADMAFSSDGTRLAVGGALYDAGLGLYGDDLAGSVLLYTVAPLTLPIRLPAPGLYIDAIRGIDHT